MRLHVVGLPHTETTRGYPTCAYTGKIFRFGKMMMPLGYEVIVYAGEENEAECTEHVPLVSRDERIEWFGEHNHNTLWGHLTWNPDDVPYKVMNARAVAEITKRAGPRDLICLLMGHSQQFIANSLPALTACEPFVGYEGISTKYCAFESHAWRHTLYGKNGIDDGRNYDAVIPNYFDPDDFHLSSTKGDDLLFVGRVIERKGPHIAAKVAAAAGRKLIIAGPGAHWEGKDRLVGLNCVMEGNHIEYVGPVEGEQRAELMANAAVLLAPTIYIEPFGGVAVEAMLSGTPVVASNFGAFTETVIPSVSGYRFNTLAQGVDSVEYAARLDPESVREYAIEHFSLTQVGPLFDAWFRQLEGLWDGGWNWLPEGRVPL